MNSSLGVLLGGIVPALAFGIGALFQKQSNIIGIGQGGYLLFFAMGIVAAAVVAHYRRHTRFQSMR